MSFSSIKKSSIIENKFVSKAVLDENLQEKVVENAASLQSSYEPRSLYEQLQSNKLKSEEERREKTRFSKTIKTLDPEELEFLFARQKQDFEKTNKEKEEELSELALFKQKQQSILNNHNNTIFSSVAKAVSLIPSKNKQNGDHREHEIETVGTEELGTKESKFAKTNANQKKMHEIVASKSDYQKQILSSIVVKRKQPRSGSSLSSLSSTSVDKNSTSKYSSSMTTTSSGGKVTSGQQEKNDDNDNQAKKPKLSSSETIQQEKNDTETNSSSLTGLVAYGSDSESD